MNHRDPTDELDELLKVISQPLPSKQQAAKIPLKEPGSYKNISKVLLSKLEGILDSPIPAELTEEQRSSFETLQTNIEVVFGKSKLSLAAIASLKEGNLLPLHHSADQPVEIYVNGTLMAYGEIVAIDQQLGVKITSFFI